MAQVEAFDEFTVGVARETWATFRREPVLFLIAGVVVMVVSVVTLGVLIGPLSVGFVELVRKVRAGEPVAVSVLFSRMDSLVPSSVALFIVGVLATIGLILLVAPGLAVLFFSSWSLPAIAYRRLGGVDSLRHSVEVVRAYPMHTLAVMFAIWIAHAIGGMVVFGALITLPLGTIAMAIAYERLAAAMPSTYAAG
jgi:hypothetical protein